MTNTANFHPSLELLTDFSQGKLATGISVALSAHLELCEICQEKASKLESEAAKFWAKAADDKTSPDFSDMISAIVGQAQTTYDESAGKQERPPVNEIHMLHHSVTLPRVLAKAASQGLVWKTLAGDRKSVV